MLSLTRSNCLKTAKAPREKKKVTFKNEVEEFYQG